MEITSFILGVCAVIGVAVVTLVIVGMVKIHKLAKMYSSILEDLNFTRNHVYDSTREDRREINQRIDHMDQHASHQFEDLKRDLTDHIQNVQRNLEESFRILNDQRIHDIDEISREFESRQKDLISYIDSRIDKLQSKKEATTK